MTVAAAETYMSREVVRRSGATYRQLDYWCRAGLFGEQLRGRGSGRHRRGFTEEDVKVARGLARLSAAGCLGSGGGGAAAWNIDRFAAEIRGAVEVGEVIAVVNAGACVSLSVNVES